MELTINNITKQYGNVTVLDDVSYRFTPGIYGILGANGAGKTTLFRIICGLMRANCGNIQYDHKDIVFSDDNSKNINQILLVTKYGRNKMIFAKLIATSIISENIRE